MLFTFDQQQAGDVDVYALIAAENNEVFYGCGQWIVRRSIWLDDMNRCDRWCFFAVAVVALDCDTRAASWEKLALCRNDLGSPNTPFHQTGDITVGS
jgi:hypothetical protein